MALASPFGTPYPPKMSILDLANALLSGVSPSGTQY